MKSPVTRPHAPMAMTATAKAAWSGETEMPRCKGPFSIKPLWNQGKERNTVPAGAYVIRLIAAVLRLE
jgi:hypothetical protein